MVKYYSEFHFIESNKEQSEYENFRYKAKNIFQALNHLIKKCGFDKESWANLKINGTEKKIIIKWAKYSKQGLIIEIEGFTIVEIKDFEKPCNQPNGLKLRKVDLTRKGN